MMSPAAVLLLACFAAARGPKVGPQYWTIFEWGPQADRPAPAASLLMTRVGGALSLVLTLTPTPTLILKAELARREDYRHTEMWLLLRREDRPPKESPTGRACVCSGPLPVAGLCRVNLVPPTTTLYVTA
jgi:hypothetical protein